MEHIDNNRITAENCLQVQLALDVVRDRLLFKIDNLREDVNFIHTLLGENHFSASNDIFLNTVKIDTQKELEFLGTLPPLPSANEDWDAPSVNNEDSGNSSEEDEEEPPPIDWEMIRAQKIPFSSLINNDEDDYRYRFQLKLTKFREESFLYTGLYYLLQVYNDIYTSRLNVEKGLFSSSISTSQQAVEKLLKITLLVTHRRGYLDSLNEHVLGIIARRIDFPKKNELSQLTDKFEYINREGLRFYSSLAVRTKYPPKNIGLRFLMKEIPCFRFTEEEARNSIELFVSILSVVKEALAAKIMEHFPSGQLYLPSFNAILTLKGTSLLYPEDVSIEIL